MVTGRDLIEWAGTMPVPSGDGAGEPWQVVPWQRRVLSAIVRPGVQTIAATCGRGNGKTALAALIARAYLPGGPLYAKGRRVLVVSHSHERAREVVTDLEAWREPGWLVANNHQAARVKAGGATVRALAANPKTIHGIRADVLVCDEIAMWTQAERLYSGIRTSLGKRAGSRILAVGTRPIAGSGHVFDRLLNGGADVVLQYAATPEDERAGRLGWRRTWAKANPSLSVLPSLEAAIRAEWKEAQGDDMAMARFKSLRLNMGTADVAENVLLDPVAWERCEVETLPERRGPYVLGIDTGGVNFTGAAAYWPLTSRLEAMMFCGGIPDLTARGRADQVGGLYRRMESAGELSVQPGRRTPDYGEAIRKILELWGAPNVIVMDRFKEGELRDALDSGGMPRGRAVVVRGMGAQDGAEDVRRFRRCVLEGRVRVARSIVLRSCLSEARVIATPAGDWKLSRGSIGGRRARGRDDGLVAAILAVAEADRLGMPPDRP